ncbi:glycosyltransferase [Spirosoma fluminis]
MLATDRPPVVSVLIAARNEEANILACLRAVAQLDYPPEAMDVLVGNDNSTDRTYDLVAEFIADKPNFRLFNITKSLNSLTGKANVLAQLAHEARGEYLFFTDADTQVFPTWIKGMNYHFLPNMGIVTGVTSTRGLRPFDKLQAVDWLYNILVIHTLSRLSVPVSSMGNNMAVSRQAYDAIGGYESIPFSITEDHALFEAITQKGFGFRNLISESVLAYTEPVDTLRQLINQRKRWMRGAMKLPLWLVILLHLNYLTIPLILPLALVSPSLALGIYVPKLLGQTLGIWGVLIKFRQTKLWPYMFAFEGYQLIIGPFLLVSYWLNNQVEWKGRTYN